MNTKVQAQKGPRNLHWHNRFRARHNHRPDLDGSGPGARFVSLEAGPVDGGRWSTAFAQRMAIAANRVLAA
jgi:hypothetical protein